MVTVKVVKRGDNGSKSEQGISKETPTLVKKKKKHRRKKQIQQKHIRKKSIKKYGNINHKRNPNQ